jgi:hypothetical protein
MPTLLVTRRMNPELAARVAARVAGRRAVRGASPSALRAAALRPLLVGAARVVAAVGLTAVVAIFVLRQRQKLEDFEAARGTLVGEVEAKAALLTDADRAAAARMESFVQRAAATYEGDYVAAALREPGGFDAALARGAVYVRGPSEQLTTASGTVQAASASVRDPFLTCLVAPPAARTERALLEKVHRAYAGDLEPPAGAVRRLRDVQLGLPFLAPAWAAKVAAAQDWDELAVLRRAFEKAPVDAATAGLRAGLLIVAVDEPGDAGATTELDGEKPHPVRVGLVDLASSSVLLRYRGKTDPAGFSPEKRPLYASGLDSCALAFDVRASLTRRL